MSLKVRDLFNQHLVVTCSLLLAAIVYGRFYFFGHISWDDPEMVFANKAVKGFDLSSLFTKHYVGNYIPLTMLLHSIAWQLFGDNNGGHHLLNVILHLVNGWLVYRVSIKLFPKQALHYSGIIAAIFLLHPVQTESVAWIGELKTILYTTFFLLAVLHYFQFRESQKQKDLLITGLYFLLSCMSKSSAVVLPLSLIAIDIIQERKFTIKFILNKLPLLAVSILVGLINIKTQTADQFINHSHMFPYHQRFANAGWAILKYLGMFVFPSNLSVLYPFPEFTKGILFVGWGLLIIITSMLVFLYRKKNLTIFSLVILFLVNLALVLQILPFGEVLFADRYLYLPLIFVSMIAVHFISLSKIDLRIVSPILIIALVISGFARGNAWKNSETLYKDVIDKFPDSFVALNSLGVEMMFNNRDDEALNYFNNAIKTAPKNYKAYYNRGLLFLKKGEGEAAIQSFNQCLSLYQYSKAYVGRASAYYLLKDMPKAMNDANLVLSIEPENAKAHFVLANCYNDIDQLDAALIEYNKCITLKQDDADFYFKRAIVWGKQQKFEESVKDLTMCLQLNGSYYEAYFWRGVAKVNLKQNPCEDFSIAARNNIAPAAGAFTKYCQ